jgi:hypothetical protein
MTTLEERVQRLEDIEAIRALKARYCAACDNGHDPAEIAEVFAADGIWESPTVGVFDGCEAIAAEFQLAGLRVSQSQHAVTNPRIEVTGDTATGVWYIVALFDRPTESGATWTLGRYHEEYVRLDGRWFIKHLRVETLGRLAAGEFLEPRAPRDEPNGTAS